MWLLHCHSLVAGILRFLARMATEFLAQRFATAALSFAHLAPLEQKDLHFLTLLADGLIPLIYRHSCLDAAIQGISYPFGKDRMAYFSLERPAGI